MANKIQFRRGSDAERGTVKLDSGEPGWTTDTKELYVGDGATYGGILVTGAGGGAGTLCTLSDVSCAGTADGRALTYQAGTWESRGTVVAEQIPALPTARITSGTFVLARIPVIDDARIPDLETLSYGAAFAVAQIPTLSASKTTTGTFGLARIPSVDDARIPDVETLSYGAAFATAQIPAIGAYKIASGTIAVARHETLDNLNGTVALSQIPEMDDGHIPDVNGLSYSGAFGTAQIPSLGAYKIAAGTLGAARIPVLPTSRITSGTFALARIPAIDDARIPNLETLSYGGAFADGQIPNLAAAKITSGSFNANRIPVLPTSRITTGTFGLARIPTMDDAHVPNLETLSYGGTFATAQIPDLPTTKITTGTFGLARIPSITNAYLTGEITSDKIPALSGTAIAYPLNADTVGTTAIKSAGVGNAELAASGLDIAKFTVGTAGLARIPTVDDARIPDLETLSYGAAFATAQIPAVGAYKITSGTLNADRIPALPTTRITSGSFNADRIPILPTNRYGSAVLVDGSRAITDDFDFAKHEAKAIALETLGSAPGSPATAQLYYNTGDNKVYVYVA